MPAAQQTEMQRYREDPNEIAWYWDNSLQRTHPVGQKAANDWGLYDTLGNVFEWCEDVWTDDYRTKGKAASSARRVVRGGSWGGDAQDVRAAFRGNGGPSHRSRNLGFRCAEFSAPGPVSRTGDQGEERAVERGVGGAEHPGDLGQASGAGWINLDAPGRDSVLFAALAPLRVSSDVEQVVLRTTTLPAWASAIVRDKFGLWAEFTIEGNAAKPPTGRAANTKKSAPPETPLVPVRQRLRWIPPGRFLMGSPPDEEGRSSEEGPQQEVTIAEGFWMFDTPCTQALWEALMGENPSEFKSSDRPVETVSWDDCQKFIVTINERFGFEQAGLSLSLPSEAQWEYACRAGTTTATYAGRLITYGDNNAPILDAIGWYGGNSGIDFELSNGVDASKWAGKQFDFDKAGTHPVARKSANPWGLYDVLGNVWEWCEDEWMGGFPERSRAVIVSPSRIPGRLVHQRRAGRAHGVPQALRALAPTQLPRLPMCRVQAGGRERSEAGERAGRQEATGSPRPVACAGRADGGRLIEPTFELKKRVNMSTMRDPPRTWSHPLHRGIPPTWPSEWGEDRLHGPWCSFAVGDVVQRLRWIPPGTFLDGVAGNGGRAV